jgi:hypothetical protein
MRACQLLFQFPYSHLQGLGIIIGLSQVFLNTNDSTLPMIEVLIPYSLCYDILIVLNEFSLHNVLAILHAHIIPSWVISDVETVAPTPSMVVPVVLVHCY